MYVQSMLEGNIKYDMQCAVNCYIISGKFCHKSSRCMVLSKQKVRIKSYILCDFLYTLQQIQQNFGEFRITRSECSWWITCCIYYTPHYLRSCLAYWPVLSTVLIQTSALFCSTWCVWSMVTTYHKSTYCVRASQSYSFPLHCIPNSHPQ